MRIAAIDIGTNSLHMIVVRVRPDFSGFFFALAEGELIASEALGSRHRVMLLNKATGTMLLTSVPEILMRAKSTNWQVSVQL